MASGMESDRECKLTHHGERPSNAKYRYVTGLLVCNLKNCDLFSTEAFAYNHFKLWNMKFLFFMGVFYGEFHGGPFLMEIWISKTELEQRWFDAHLVDGRKISCKSVKVNKSNFWKIGTIGFQCSRTICKLQKLARLKIDIRFLDDLRGTSNLT